MPMHELDSQNVTLIEDYAYYSKKTIHEQYYILTLKINTMLPVITSGYNDSYGNKRVKEILGASNSILKEGSGTCV